MEKKPCSSAIDDLWFTEFRRKVRSGEVLSSSTMRLTESLHFTGRVTVVFQNGRVLKSGYEEGYFSQRTNRTIG